MSEAWQRVVHTGTALLHGRAGANVAQTRTVYRVRQQHDTSCGVAVVAMFARVSHDEALATMFPNARRRTTFYTTYRQVIRALDHFGVPHGPKQLRVRSWEQIPTTALVAAKAAHAAGHWHWVILQRRHDGTTHVLDPDVHAGTQRLAPAEQARLRPISYLTVDPIPPGPEKARRVDRATPALEHLPALPSATSLALLTVTQARAGQLARALAELTGLSLSATRGRLARAHGRTLLRNVFHDVWSTVVESFMTDRRAGQ